MNDLSLEDSPTRVARILRGVGTWGAAVAVLILGVSVLLRLTTTLDADGSVHSRLPEFIETSARLGHRAAAMLVAVLALLAAMIALSGRPASPGRIVAALLIVLLTVFLAIIGRYTPGYKSVAVTVGNVVACMLLASTFWWLRELGASGRRDARNRPPALAVFAFAAILFQSGLGAAASAAVMRNPAEIHPLHGIVGLCVAALVMVVAWPLRSRAGHGVPARVALGVALFQFVLGVYLVVAGSPRPWPATWMHGMAALVLALALVSLIARPAATSSR